MPSPKARAREGSTKRDATTEAPGGHVQRVVVPGGNVGRLLVTITARGVSDVRFLRDEPAPVDAGSEGPAYLTAFARYFAGERVAFEDVPLDLVGTEFQQKVWAALRTIPHGKVVSYAHIAGRVGVPRGMRAVGLANGKNPAPILVPCHRVVEASGALGGFSSGLDIKRKLLALEGVGIVNEQVLPGQGSLF